MTDEGGYKELHQACDDLNRAIGYPEETVTVPRIMLLKFLALARAREEELEAKCRLWESLVEAIRGLVEDSGNVTMVESAGIEWMSYMQGLAKLKKAALDPMG